MSPLPVYVDFDDVLCETARALLDFSRRAFGTNLRFEDIRSFDVAEAFGLNSEQAARIMDLIHDPDVLLALDPVPGAPETLRHWVAAGFDVHIVTGRPPSTWRVSREWLRAHEIPFGHLVFVDKYGRNHPAEGDVLSEPIASLRSRGFRLAVDDAPDVVRVLASDMRVPTVLFHRPWNRTWQVPARIPEGAVVRCCDWKEILERFPDPAAVPAGNADTGDRQGDDAGGSRHP